MIAFSSRPRMSRRPSPRVQGLAACVALLPYQCGDGHTAVAGVAWRCAVRRVLHGVAGEWDFLLSASGHFMRTSPIMCPPRVMAAAAAYATLERQPSAAVRQAKLSEVEMEKFRQAHAGVPLYLKYPSCPAPPAQVHRPSTLFTPSPAPPPDTHAHTH